MPRRRILLIEDQASIRKVISRALDPARYQVEAVASIPDARTRLQAPPPPDLVIASVGLPVGRAADLIRQIKRNWPSLPVIALSARIELEHETAVRAAGVDVFLRKPFALDALVKTIATLLP